MAQYLKYLLKPSQRNSTIFLFNKLQKASFATSSIRFQSDFVYQKLEHRGLFRVSGSDSKNFLQGLITNDMNCVQHGCPLIYSMILNARGRVLYDIMIYGIPNTEDYFIECDKDNLDKVIKHLKMYKLRKKTEFIRVDNAVHVWSIYRPVSSLTSSIDTSTHLEEFTVLSVGEDVLHWSSDPRIKNWSGRLLAKPGVDVSAVLPDVRSSTSTFGYEESRYWLGIGEGPSDHPQGSCLPLESNGAFLNGVSFIKGCYVGQELTARSHHTGVIRKRLMPVTITTDNIEAESIGSDSPVMTSTNPGKVIGRYRSGVGKYALCLLRLSELASLPPLLVKCSKSQRTIDLTCRLPHWWPNGVLPTHHT